MMMKITKKWKKTGLLEGLCEPRAEQYSMFFENMLRLFQTPAGIEFQKEYKIGLPIVIPAARKILDGLFQKYNGVIKIVDAPTVYINEKLICMHSIKLASKHVSAIELVDDLAWHSFDIECIYIADLANNFLEGINKKIDNQIKTMDYYHNKKLDKFYLYELILAPLAFSDDPSKKMRFGKMMRYNLLWSDDENKV